MVIKKKNFFYYVNTFVILDNGKINSIYTSGKSKLCFGDNDLSLRAHKLRKKLKFFSLYELKEEFIFDNLYTINLTNVNDTKE